MEQGEVQSVERTTDEGAHVVNVQLDIGGDTPEQKPP